MTAKTQPESRGRRGPGKRREILGIVLLALGLFSGLSLGSMHAGNAQMMGPGGAATAAGLYALLGVASYLLIAAMLVGSWRTFRGRSLVAGVTEGGGALTLLASVAVLLHLPFSGGAHMSRGPGGLLGQWLGEVTASFIGPIGAALAATALLFVALVLVTEIRMNEVVVVLGWAAGKVHKAIWICLRALGRLAIAMFPERETPAERALRAEAEELDSRDHDGHDDLAETKRQIQGAVPLPLLGHDTDGIRVGQARGHADEVAAEIADRRAAISMIVAEVAAVEKVPGLDGFAPEQSVDWEVPAETSTMSDLDSARQPAEDEPADGLIIAEAPAVLAGESAAEGEDAAAVPGPIIVEPAWRTRMREREQAREGLKAEVEVDASEGPTFIRLNDGAYQLPATDLLEYLPPQGNETDKQGLYDMAERLEQAMANYGVRGKVKEIHMGPVVTMFEFAPEPGTRTGKIANLEKDLAMALEAQAVRILAPIPGKSVVGVEVPNKTREMVYLREILEDDCFTKATSKLQVALGKDIKGAPVSVNLAKMPHLLVAGTTGSGKSVAVNGMIVSLLYNASPEEVRFIMVDPKMLELSIYEGIPHLLLPVVTDPKKANLALRWAVEEMERRYELLARAGVRDITSYNSKIAGEQGGRGVQQPRAEHSVSGKKRLKVMIAGPDGTEQELQIDPDDDGISAASALAPALSDGIVRERMDPDEVSAAAAAAQAIRQGIPNDARGSGNPGQKDEIAGQAPKRLPFIVIVIDEFADLMMVAPKDVETSVARIAQKARAAGLHLILATQRPSVDVITGLIKANFPSRIALQVASRIDSRTILDQPGADTLLGNGDMLFSDRGLKLRRLHGAFLGDDEVHRVVDHLKTQAKPVYDMDILKPREEDAEEGGGPSDEVHDELYDQAVAIVCETRQASVSYIQRRLQIGYNRSARLVEQMERDGIVGPANGAKPREILAPPGDYLLQAG
jgi:DNA segregation ATPase FtsK/SpoIIIE, S-DNA-T family